MKLHTTLLLTASLLAWAAPAFATPVVEDTLPGFLSAVGSGSGEAWVAYEAAHSKTLDQLFYRDRGPGEKMNMAHAALQSWVPVAELRTFEDRWRADYDYVASRVEEVLGHAPMSSVSIWYSFDSRTGVSGEVDGHPTLGLNARMLLPYDSANTRVTIAREFFRYYAREAVSEPESLTLARRVQIEGLTMAAMERLVPGLPAWRYLQVNQATYQVYQRHQTAIARGLAAALDSGDSLNAVIRFFGHGYGDPWPNGAGRYIAFQLARNVVRDRNPLDLYLVPSRDFLFETQPGLEDLAKMAQGAIQ